MGLFFGSPFWSGNTPVRFKLAIAFFISMIALPLVMSKISIPTGMMDFGVMVISNFFFGLGVGYFVYFVLMGFEASARIFSLPIGLGINEVIDPISETQIPALGNLLGFLILLLFIRSDGHFYIVNIIIDSFDVQNLITAGSLGLFVKGLAAGIMKMFEVGLKISLPLIGITMMLDMAMGLISRVAPQFNVMIMGFNLKLLISFVALWFLLPPLINYV